ncbi:type I-E CRISPR-associated protein Cse1/CasA [Nocardia yunnanensis]|uniref:type I-E CRISPR-associated protein Cse1/CasA n=1 Tax=Nocardia yunnanensis TaxID=2382165 RepID=UPI0013C43BC2|nr:type I-E CRISPR-associated protein Cse1/CasA [Nocardia yunnanensis]
MSFDLSSQPCIPVLTRDGQRQWRSLCEVFAAADSDVDIAISHPSPGAEVACYELLLAICHAAGYTPRSPQEWSKWIDQQRSFDKVVEWLTTGEGRGRFDLFDSERPFGQNALLTEALTDLGYGPVQLMLERAKNYSQFADHVHLYDLEPVSARDAFLAMIIQHCYGLGGRVMAEGVVKQVQHTLGYRRPITDGAVGRLGARVRILAIGDNLGRTLRLNLAIHESGGTLNATWDERERRPFKAGSAMERRTMDGPSDWHSVLGRSVLLRGIDGDPPTVDRVLLCAGETVAVESEGDSYAEFDAVYVKGRLLKASLDRALWRDAHAIYSASLAPQSGDGLFGLLGTELTRPVRLLAVGLAAVNRDVDGWVRDIFPFNPDRTSELRDAAEVGVQLAEDAAVALKDAGQEAFRCIYPACPDSKAQRDKLKARFDASDYLWARAGTSFHRLLDRVEAGHDTRSELSTHAQTLRGIASEALDERLRSLPPNGRGWQAKVRARDKLAKGLQARRFKEFGS